MTRDNKGHIDFKYHLYCNFSCPDWYWVYKLMTWRIADYLDFYS